MKSSHQSKHIIMKTLVGAFLSNKQHKFKLLATEIR